MVFSFPASWKPFQLWRLGPGRMMLECNSRPQLTSVNFFRQVVKPQLYLIKSTDSLFASFVDISQFLHRWLVFYDYHVMTARDPPIVEVIQSGVVPRFVEFLARDDYPQLQAIPLQIAFSVAFVF